MPVFCHFHLWTEELKEVQNIPITHLLYNTLGKKSKQHKSKQKASGKSGSYLVVLHIRFSPCVCTWNLQCLSHGTGKQWSDWPSSDLFSQVSTEEGLWIVLSWMNCILQQELGWVSTRCRIPHLLFSLLGVKEASWSSLSFQAG